MGCIYRPGFPTDPIYVMLEYPPQAPVKNKARDPAATASEPLSLHSASWYPLVCSDFDMVFGGVLVVFWGLGVWEVLGFFAKPLALRFNPLNPKPSNTFDSCDRTSGFKLLRSLEPRAEGSKVCGSWV